MMEARNKPTLPYVYSWVYERLDFNFGIAVDPQEFTIELTNLSNVTAEDKERILSLVHAFHQNLYLKWQQMKRDHLSELKSFFKAAQYLDPANLPRVKSESVIEAARDERPDGAVSA